MNYKISEAKFNKLQTDILILPVLQNEKITSFGLPKKMSDSIEMLTGGLSDFKGEKHEIYNVSTRGQVENLSRIILLGLGEKENYTCDILRDAFGKLVKTLKNYPIQHATIWTREKCVVNKDWARFTQTVVEGIELGAYSFDAYKKKSKDKESKLKLKNIDLISIPNNVKDQVLNGFKKGMSISKAVNFARDLGNHPGNVVTPTMLAETAESLAEEFDLKCTILSEKEMERLKMGALLGVSKGSNQPAKMIILEHQKGKKKQSPILFVGKGVTFDSGGISIKPGKSMDEMKFDMSGGGNVLGIMRAVADLKIPLNVIGIIPSVENLLGGSATKPGDILTSMSGTTIEVLNTDAEGRLILADALTYAERYKPSAVVDLATLTGAVVVALGPTAAGLMGNDQSLIEEIQEAGKISGEKVWPLPLYDDYKDQIKRDVSDIKNIGQSGAGSSVAAAFLAEFTQKYKWVHLDIAGVAWSTKDLPISPKGSTGFGIRLLVEWILKSKANK